MKFHECSFLMVLIGFNSIVDNFLKVKTMIIQASNGCYLTEKFEVDINERRFVKSINVTNIEEANLWKEVTETEKDNMIEDGRVFEPSKIDYSYLTNLNTLLSDIPSKINEYTFTNNEALEMKDYFPKWENLIGSEATEGFKFVYSDTLLEVVTPHTFSEDINPSQQPMMLNELPESEDEQSNQYYKAVVSEESENI